MIMFRDQPQDEGHPTFQSLEDLNQSLQQSRDAYNTAPQDELGGLSPEQVARLIYTDWEIQGEKQKTATQALPPWGEKPGLALATAIPAEELAGSVFFQNCRTFLIGLRESGGVRGTQAGNLPRAFVKQMREELAARDSFDERLDAYYNVSVLKEQELWALHEARVVCQCGGLIRRCKGKFLTTRKYEPLLREAKAGALFAHLFHAYFRKYNTAYGDKMPDCPSLQSTFAFTLYQTGRIARNWMSVSDMAPRVMLPIARDQLEALTMPYRTEGDFLRLRLIDALAGFGLIEMESGKAYSRQDRDGRIRVSPLWDLFLKFAI